MTTTLKTFLASWTKLNEGLLSASEKDCAELLEVEVKTQKRVQFVLRIHSALNKRRRLRERTELLKRISK